MSWVRAADRYFSLLSEIVGVPVHVFKQNTQVKVFGNSEVQLDNQGKVMPERPDYDFARLDHFGHTFLLGPFRKGSITPEHQKLLKYAVSLAGDARGVSEQVQHRVAEQDAVLEFLHAVSPVRSMQQLVERSVQFFVHEFNASNAVLFAFDSKHRFLDSRYVSVYEAVERIVLGELEQSKVALFVRDLRSDPVTCKVEHVEVIPQSLAAFPLVQQRKLVGALIVYGESLNVQHASALARELSRMVQNACDFEAVKTSASVDVLTGLHNRSYFVPTVEKMIPELRERKSALTVLLFDVDDFKRFNDTHGHPAGDQVLSRIGEVVKATLPKEAVSARYGGEEFVVALPEYDSQRGQEVAESLRKAIGQECELSVSIGQMTCLNSSANLSQLIQEADKALYRAKHLGKNCVVPFVMVDKTLGVIDASRS